MSIGVIIGRFQVDQVHEGHIQLIETVNKSHNHLLVMLGCRLTWASRDNPLSYLMREQMIRESFPKAIIVPIHDCQTDEEWSRRVDAIIRTTFPNQPATLYGGRNSFIPHYKGKYPTRQLDFGNETTSGAEKRNFIFETPTHSKDFRAGVIHALMSISPMVFPSVDIAMIKGNNFPDIEVLLGYKNNETKWRFPGGMVDVEDANYEKAARRELMEETGMVSEAKLEYVDSFKIKDWRLKDREDSYMTTFFVAPYSHGSPKAGDDLDQVKWVTLREMENIIIEDHRPLAAALMTYLSANKGKINVY